MTCAATVWHGKNKEKKEKKDEEKRKKMDRRDAFVCNGGRSGIDTCFGGKKNGTDQ